MKNDCEIIGEFVTITKLFPVYKTIYNGVEFAVCQAPLGGAAAAQIMEQLIAGGAKRSLPQDAAAHCSPIMKVIFISLFLHYGKREHHTIICRPHGKYRSTKMPLMRLLRY